MKKWHGYAGLLLSILLLFSLFPPLGAGAAEAEPVGYSAARVETIDLSHVTDLRAWGEGTEAAYKITDAAGLLHLSTLVDHGETFAGKTVYLACDLDLSAVRNFQPIGTSYQKYFGGTFDGQGHIIDNLILCSTDPGITLGGERLAYVGLFGYLIGGTVRNLIVGSGCSVSYLGTADVSYLAGLVGGTRAGTDSATVIDNCQSMAAVHGIQYAAGILCRIEGRSGSAETVIRNCTNTGLLTCRGTVGGLTALVSAKATLENCRNTGVVTLNCKNGSKTTCGAGLAAQPTGSGRVTVRSCVNNGTLTGPDYIGAFFGAVTSSGNSVTDSVNYGLIDAKKDRGGERSGLLGAVDQSVTVASTGNVNREGEEDPTLKDVDPGVPDFTKPDPKPAEPDSAESEKETANGSAPSGGCNAAVRGTLSLLLAVLLMLLTLGACGTKGNGEDPKTEPAQTTGPEVETVTDLPGTEALQLGKAPWFPTMDPISYDHDNIRAAVEEEVLAYRTTGAYGYNAWPTVCRDESGTLYAVCSENRLAHICPYGQTVMVKSTDGGKTWESVGVISDTMMDDRDAGILYIGGGKMLISWFSHSARYYYETEREQILSDARAAGVYDEVLAKLEDMQANPSKYAGEGNYVRISEDYGATWGEAIPVPVTSPHGPIQHSSGLLLFAGKVNQSKQFRNGELALFESRNQGETWEPVSTIPFPYGCGSDNLHEVSLVETKDGNLLAAIRVEGASAKLPLTIYTTVSKDGGRTWSIPQPTDLNGAPAHLLRLSDGSILMTYSRRSAPCGIRAVISTDGGETWSAEMILSESASGDLGYPSTVELDDHTLVTTFYKRSGSDSKPSVFAVRWRLSE